MISKLLIANRGEIARRVIRTCNEMGIATVAVFSDADRHAPFVNEASEAVSLGGNTPSESYLRSDAIIQAAITTGATAIHPGYGFLAENADFARACAERDLIFIGPSPEAIASMGDKLAAKRTMESVGIPTLASVEVSSDDPTFAIEQANAMGYPVLVKASAGGGGKGMRIVGAEPDLIESIASAVREASAAFGDGTVFLEKYLEAPRHIEVQVFGDSHGNATHLFERECSIQRRHQKIIEESPSPAIDQDMRTKMGDAAISACHAVKYVGAGTVEFLYADDAFYFLEMNSRLQVEHPVTEFVTGLDLVRLQIEVADGAPLPPAALEPSMTGHAIEARLYAEDPRNGYLPSVGTLHRFQINDARVDSAVEEGDVVPVYYDPMIAKVIVHAPTRIDAIRKLSTALATASIHGVTTNRDLLVGVLRHDEFVSGATDTHFLERHPAEQLGLPLADRETAQRHAVGAALVGQAHRRLGTRVLPHLPSGWRNSPSQPQAVSYAGEYGSMDVTYRFTRTGVEAGVDGVDLAVTIHSLCETSTDLQFGTHRVKYHVHNAGDHWLIDGPDGSSDLVELPRFPSNETELKVGSMVSPMPGKVIRIDIAEGDSVTAGTSLIVIEAMKMEHTVAAPASGTVSSVNVSLDQQVDANQLLVVIEASA